MHVRLLEPPAVPAQDSGADIDATPQNDADVGDGLSGDGQVGDVADAGDGLVHRYDFGGAGTVVLDSVGSADGTVVGGAALDGAGGVVLDGVDDYVNLPNRLVSVQSSATIALWLEWYGGPCWQRLFDFGNNDAGEDAVGNGTTSLFVTASTCPEGVLASLFEYPGEKHAVLAPAVLPANQPVFVALVVNGGNAQYELYLDGTLVGAAELVRQLNELDDINNWLGRSQWVQDLALRGRYDELRIYSQALGSDRIAMLFQRGPDQP
jgi:hypothetical protein